MDKDIQQRFLQAENALIESFSRGEDSLMSFESSWTSLHADFSRCLSNGELLDDTISIANTVASRIAIIASCFFELHTNLRTQLDGVESILDGLNGVTISPSSTLAIQSPESSLPPFIKSAYTWLLANIHNPYPSSDTKASIIGSSGCSMNSVSAWFISARRRIGWTTICRKHFNNRRADTVNAAYRALVKEDPSRILPHTVFHDFIQMKAAAQDLYASTFTKSALAGDLDVVVKDMTEEDRLQLEQEKKERAQEEQKRHDEGMVARRKQMVSERQVQMTPAALTSYPSPSHSRSSSPVPILGESWTNESDEAEADPPVLAGRKRRASISLESTDSRQSPCMNRPTKRLCAKTPQSLVETSLPSPASTTDGLDINDEVETVTPLSTCSKKRRLSDADSHSAPKRPRSVLTGHRAYAVSDPLPKSSVSLEGDIDDWFHTNFFEIPPPVESVGFDQSTPLDIELFSGYRFSDTHKNSLPTSMDAAYSAVPFEQQTINLDASSHDSFTTPLILDNLDHFLAAFDPNNSCIQVTVPTMAAAIHHPSAYLTGHTPSGSYSWTDLLNSDQSLPTVDQFSQSPPRDDLSQILPEIGFPALQFPSLISTIPQAGTLPVGDARQAKLEQLQLLREQARLLERDLAVSV